MPRFIDTHTGEFVWVPDAQNARYAILSHTWRPETDGGEQSYADVLKLQLEVAELSKRNDGSKEVATVLSHPSLSDKIKSMCRVARAAGYRLVWIDSCCIDKSSSAELSEAINSMYDWYRLSDVCYVYLADVWLSDDAPKYSMYDMTQESRWYTRGWTLQELIAPANVLFFSKSWRSFGTKTELADILQAITNIDSDILTGRASLDSVSVSKRMSWAAARVTTRVEDEAYALMGLFGVRMPPIYGEGRNAFLRLQEEIVKIIPDQTIFAWGLNYCHVTVLDDGEYYRGRGDSWGISDAYAAHVASQPWGLLASSPASFMEADTFRERHALYRPVSLASWPGTAFLRPREHSEHPQQRTFKLDCLSPIPSSAFAASLGLREDSLPPLQCTFTPEGIRLQLLCLETAHLPLWITSKIYKAALDQPHLEYVAPVPDPMQYLALLRCGDEGRTNSILTLPLYPAARTNCGRGSPGNPGMLVATHRPLRQRKSSAWPLRAVGLSHRLLQQLLSNGTSLQLRDVLICRQWAPGQADMDPDLFPDCVPDECREFLDRLSQSMKPVRIDGGCAYQLTQIFGTARISELRFSSLTSEHAGGRDKPSTVSFNLLYAEPLQYVYLQDDDTPRVCHVIEVRLDLADTLYSVHDERDCWGNDLRVGGARFSVQDRVFVADASALERANGAESRLAHDTPSPDRVPEQAAVGGERCDASSRSVEWNVLKLPGDPPFLRGVAEFTIYAYPAEEQPVEETDRIRRTLRLTLEACESFDPPDQFVLSIDLSAQSWGSMEGPTAARSSDDMEDDQQARGTGACVSEPYDGSVLVREIKVPPRDTRATQEVLKENENMRARLDDMSAQVRALAAQVSTLQKTLTQMQPKGRRR
ncbi:HET-domain-containing protein [Trametes cingulata]|nr:HET-domain-containing protein [Trametes cingulata]